MSDEQKWQERLGALARRYQIPGAALAVLQDGRVSQAATGVLNLETGVEVTPDSLFQVGSVTKSYTATMIMQLVGEGRLDLDEPIVKTLPDLELGEPAAQQQVTMRHLLAHTSGIQGDHFEDTGRGDDVLARYVESCSELGFSHPVGATMSYCNTGYVIAGRIIEVLTGQTWDHALRERIIEPMGLTHTVTLPEETLRFRVAHGHVADPGKEPHLGPAWGLPRSLGPAGLICATAADMVALGRLHLDRGKPVEGSPLLAEELVGAMQEPQVEIPDRWTLGSHWGLGWILYDWEGARVYGHDGASMGQSAVLRVVPDRGVVVGILCNGGHADKLYRDLLSELLAELCDVHMSPALEPATEPPDVNTSVHAGTYERVGVRIELEDKDGELHGRVISTGPLAELEEDPEDEVTLVPVSDGVFVTRVDDEGSWTPMVFYELPDGAPYLHMGARATPRVS